MTAHPRTEWMLSRLYRGKPALDVLIVGAGQSGLCIAFALMRDRVRNILLVDARPRAAKASGRLCAHADACAAQGSDGPDLGIPSLTFEPGTIPLTAPAVRRPEHDPTGAWHDYLQWYRRVLALPVRNGVAATAIAPGELDDADVACW